MKNYIQRGEAITVPSPAIVASGAGVLFGVASTDAAPGEDLAIATVGVFSLPKVALEDIPLGAVLYWDDAPGNVTLDNASGTNPAIGHAVEAAPGTFPAAKVRLSV